MNNNTCEEHIAPYVEGNAGDAYRKFADMPLSTLQRLVDLGFVEMGVWNHCNGVAELFLPFLKRNPSFNAHGYVVSETGDGKAILVEGVEHSHLPLTLEEIIDFVKTFREADDLEVDSAYAYCWYD